MNNYQTNSKRNRKLKRLKILKKLAFPSLK